MFLKSCCKVNSRTNPSTRTFISHNKIYVDGFVRELTNAKQLDHGTFSEISRVEADAMRGLRGVQVPP